MPRGKQELAMMRLTRHPKPTPIPRAAHFLGTIPHTTSNGALVVYAYLRSPIVPGCGSCPPGDTKHCGYYKPERQVCLVAARFGAWHMQWLAQLPWITPIDVGTCLDYTNLAIHAWALDRQLSQPLEKTEDSRVLVERIRMRRELMSMRMKVQAQRNVLARELGLTPMARMCLEIKDEGEDDPRRPRTVEDFMAMEAKEVKRGESGDVGGGEADSDAVGGDGSVASGDAEAGADAQHADRVEDGASGRGRDGGDCAVRSTGHGSEVEVTGAGAGAKGMA